MTSLELAKLRTCSYRELQDRFAEGNLSRNRVWLINRIAWRLQAIADGFVDLHPTGRKNDAYRYFLKSDQPVLEDIPPLEPLKRPQFGRQ